MLVLRNSCTEIYLFSFWYLKDSHIATVGSEFVAKEVDRQLPVVGPPVGRIVAVHQLSVLQLQLAGLSNQSGIQAFLLFKFYIHYKMGEK